MNHTKEPWHYEINGFSRAILLGDKLTSIGYISDIVNARRIVACVNACAGIRTEALESGLIKHLLNDAYMRTLNPFDPNPQNKMDMKYLGKPVYEEDFE